MSLLIQIVRVAVTVILVGITEQVWGGSSMLHIEYTKNFCADDYIFVVFYKCHKSSFAYSMLGLSLKTIKQHNNIIIYLGVQLHHKLSWQLHL